MKQYLLKVWMTAALSLLVVGGVWGQESYTPGYPNVSDITHESAKLNVSASVGGMIQLSPRPVYAPSHYTLFIVLDANEDKPSIEEVISWSFDGNGELIPEGRYGEIGLSASNTKFSIEAYNLSSETSYVAYFVTTEDFETSVIGATEPTAVPFTTTAPPTPLTASLSPADDAPNVPVSTSTFVLTFSEDVELAGGTVLVELYQSGTVVGSTGLYSSNISNKVVSLSFNHTLEYEKEYEIVFPANAIKSVATGALFPGLSAGKWSFTTEAAPFTLDLQEPEDGASDVALNASLVATFNQNIQLGSGAEVHIYDYQSESLVETITTGLSVSVSDLIINSTTDLAEGTHYYVVIPNGAVETTSGAPFAGLTEKDAWDFTTVYLPLENPVLSPAHNADGVLKDAVLSLQFDKDIELGSGTIGIYNGSTQEKLFDASSTAVSIVNNNTLQIDLSNNALAHYGKIYDVRIASTLIKRVGSDVYFAGFDAGGWSFTTEVQPDPVLMATSSLSPADGDVEVSRAPTLQVSFDQEITWGPSGVLTIRRSDNDATAATISREQTGASISQDQLSIVFSSESLEYGTEYYVIIDEGFVKALNSSAVYAGLSDKTVWTFTTETAPPVWVDGYPSISNQTVDDFQLDVWADVTGAFYGVLTQSSTQPTAEQIAQGHNSVGSPARIAFNQEVNSISTVSVSTIAFNTQTLLGQSYFLHLVYRSGGTYPKYGEIKTIEIDRIIPTVEKTYPANNSMVFPAPDAIEITFSELVVGTNGEALTESYFSLVHNSSPVTPIQFTVSVSAEGERTVATLRPTTVLIDNTAYILTINPVYDLSGNPSAVSTIYFETDGIAQWTGTHDSNWNEPDNWGGTLPVDGKSVLIPGSLTNYPLITSETINVHNLTIAPGAVLSHSGGTLNVSGLFHLQSSSDVNASYINTGGVLNATPDSIRVDQVISNIDLTYIISSPTNSSTAANFGAYFPLYRYDNPTDTWEAISSAMTPGLGYRMWTDDTMVSFTGSFNAGNIGVSLLRTDGQGYGWNFVGNPYPASIDWTELNITEASSVENAFWMWLPTSRSYGSFSAATNIPINISSSIIPSNHGFLVKVKQGLTSGSLEFLPSAQVANDAMYLKSASSKPLTSHFKLAGISAEGFRDEFAVAFVDGAVEGVDRYDMEKRFANQRHLFELFSLSGSLKSVINSVPNVGFIEIPLGYNALQTGTVGVELVNSNLEDAVVILVDELTDEEMVLEEGGRVDVFISQKGVVNDRFKLRVSRVVTSDASIVVTEEQNSRIRVVVKDRNIHLFLSEPGSYEGFMICDVQGRVIRSGALSGAQFESLGSFSDGVYLIQLFNSEIGSVENVKVVVY